MLRNDLITCQQAAVVWGLSSSTTSRALAQGRLKYADPTRKLLLRQRLELRFANATRPKADCPQKVKRDDKAAERLALIPDPPSPPEIATTYWERLNQKLQLVLEGTPPYWSQGPVPQRLKLFCQSIDLLRAQVELEGLRP